MKKQLVFVYGTLRKEGSNAHFLKNATYIEHRCYAEGQLYDTGLGYPALILEEDKWVTGELYEVTKEELKRLDELEDFVENRANNLYDRIVAKIKTSVGDKEALMYVMNTKANDFISIEENDWIKYLQR